MFIKVTTTRTKNKTYRYVKLAQSEWIPGKGPQEKIISTLGTLEEVIKSKDTLITGLKALSLETTRQKKRSNRQLPGPSTRKKALDKLEFNRLKRTRVKNVKK